MLEFYKNQVENTLSTSLQNSNLKLDTKSTFIGGPFFSPDGSKVSFRASRPKPGKELEKYKQLLR
jgi:Tol biopolymer transport system component